MLTIESELTVPGLTGRQVTDFLLAPEDDRYRAWWPGTHHELHLLRRGPVGGHLHDVVLMDEHIGHRHVRLAAEVIESIPGQRIVWRLRLGSLSLPCRVTLTLCTHGQEVDVRHTIDAGWSGPGRLVDPLWRLYLSRSFARDMDDHVRTEFPLLRDLLQTVWSRRSDCSPWVEPWSSTDLPSTPDDGCLPGGDGHGGRQHGEHQECPLDLPRERVGSQQAAQGFPGHGQHLSQQ